MNLAQYRSAKGLTLDALAEQLGLTGKSVVQKYCAGQHWPNAIVLDQIIRATDHEVTIEAMHERRLAWLKERDALQQEHMADAA